MGRNAFAKDTDINVSVVALAYKIFGMLDSSPGHSPVDQLYRRPTFAEITVGLLTPSST